MIRWIRKFIKSITPEPISFNYDPPSPDAREAVERAHDWVKQGANAGAQASERDKAI